MLETIIAWCAVAAGLALLIGGTAYIVRIEGTTRVLAADLASLTGKVDMIFNEFFKPPVGIGRRRLRPAGRGKK